MTHHTKTLGDLGVLKAQIDLFEQGYIVAIPFTEHAPFDLIIYKNGVCKSVQVKARSLNKNGRIQVSFRSSYSDSNGYHVRSINKNAVDLYCIYCPDTDKCYYFNPKNFNKSVSLRVEKPKNNQTQGVNFADDYCQVP